VEWEENTQSAIAALKTVKRAITGDLVLLEEKVGVRTSLSIKDS
jgi:hypothetical protein